MDHVTLDREETLLALSLKGLGVNVERHPFVI